MSVKRAQAPMDDPYAPRDTSVVEFAPAEVKPFLVRCEFRWVEDEEGAEHLIVVGGPSLAERADRPPAEIGPTHREMLRQNEEIYRRMARHYVEVNPREARGEREAMLSAKRHYWGDRVKPESLIYLANEYVARRSEPGIIQILAREYGVDRRTIRRHLERCESNGYLPAGTLERRRRSD